MELVTLINKLNGLNVPIWIVVPVVVYEVILKNTILLNIKEANAQFVKMVEKCIVDFNVDEESKKIEDLINIICVNYSINRSLLISYEVAVNKAFYRIISKAEYSRDILQYLGKYDEIKNSAIRIDGKMKYGKNSRNLFYAKAFFIAMVLNSLIIGILSLVSDNDINFNCYFLFALILYSFFISLIGALLVIVIERIKDYIIKLNIR